MKRPAVLGWVCLGVLFLGGLGAEGAPKGEKRKLPPDEALKQKVDRHAAAGSLLAVLTDFAAEAGVTIRVDWKALEKTGVTSKTRLSVKLEKVTYRQVLEVILSRVGQRGHPLSWRTDADDVIISTHRRILLMEDGARRGIEKLAGKKASSRRAANRFQLPRNRLPGVKFDKLPFRDTLKFFQTVLRENFHVNWRALQQDGVDPDTPITLNVRNISIARAMDLVFDQVNAERDKLASVYWVVDRGVLLVSTGNALNKSTITRVIDAGGALLVQPDNKGPRIDLQAYADNNPGKSSTQGESIFDEDETDRTEGKTGSDSYAEQKKKHAEKVINTIKTMIGADMWEPEGKGAIRVLNNKVVITQTMLGFKLLESALR